MFLSRKINNIFHPAIGEILMLHRVTENQSRFAQNKALEISPERLANIIDSYRREECVFVSIDDVYEIMIGKKRFDKKFVCITFDDGYRDNYEVAYPILKKENIPFCIYVTTDFYEKRAKLWWYFLDKKLTDEMDFNRWHKTLLATPTSSIIEKLKNAFPDVEEEMSAISQELTLNGSQISELSKDALCTIGAHTISHPRLDALNLEEQLFEIKQSKLKLEELIAAPVQHFSYPFGAYNESTIKLVGDFGFKTATTYSGRAVRNNSKLLELDRIAK